MAIVRKKESYNHLTVDSTLPAVYFDLCRGKMKRNQAELEIDFENYIKKDRKSGGIFVGDYCIDWVENASGQLEACGGFILDTDIYMGIELANLQLNDNQCLHGDMALISINDLLPFNMDAGPDCYPFVLDLQTGKMDFGEEGSTELLPAALCKRCFILGGAVR